MNLSAQRGQVLDSGQGGVVLRSVGTAEWAQSLCLPHGNPAARPFLLLKNPLEVENQKMDFERTLFSEVRVIYSI